jgi:hypothetical protein
MSGEDFQKIFEEEQKRLFEEMEEKHSRELAHAMRDARQNREAA